MSENGRLFTRSSLPCGLIGMLALVALVETFLARGDHGLASDRAVDWVERGRSIGRQSARGEVLCFGDSLVKFGIVPRVLENRLGKRTLNCALIGGQPMSSYFLLKRALASGARPAAIVVDFHAFLLAEAPQFSTPVLPGLVTTSECLDLAWTTRDLSFFATVMLSRPLYSLRARHEIRTSIMQALRGEAHPLTELTRNWVKFVRRNWDLNEGAMIMGKNSQFHGQTDNFNQPLFPENWRCEPVNARYVRRFMELATAKGIPVFWLIPPQCPQVQAGRERVGSNAAYDRFVQRMQAKFPEVVVIDGRRVGYEDSLFSDPIHLDRDGAVTWSVAIAEAIRPYLAGQTGSRWIDLPNTRSFDPAGIALEDVNQSGAFITAREASKLVR